MAKFAQGFKKVAWEFPKVNVNPFAKGITPPPPPPPPPAPKNVSAGKTVGQMIGFPGS